MFDCGCATPALPLLPSPREAAGRGRGWGVYRQEPLLRCVPRHPPPPNPSPPRARARGGRGDQCGRLRDLAACFARGLLWKSRPLMQRAQGMPGARCARSRVCEKKHTRRNHGHTGKHPAFPAQWFTAYSALSPVTGLVCHRRRRKLVSVDLNASVGASGPHGFAVRVGAVRQERRCVHRIPRHVRDDRETPLPPARDGASL
jgi:hypothetical protein